jgi:hypothetical protein
MNLEGDADGVERPKPVESFNWRRKAIGQRDNMCRRRQAAYKHEPYSANKIRYIAQARREQATPAVAARGVATRLLRGAPVL